jgi:mycoredoxin
MSQKIILYGSPICAMVPSVRGTLERANADYEYVDIFGDAQARARVREINRGYESVPTLVFPDGSTLTEPSPNELKAKLKTLGYQVPTPTWTERALLLLKSPMTPLVGVVLLVVSVVNGTTWLMAVGAVVLALGLLASRTRS